jgi:hypothetical protein
MIRSIPTEFAGVKFRSRLEARWAVLFEELGLDWRYEAEPYQFSDGLSWLPDFWLPTIGFHIEVKPTEPALGDHCIAQIDAFNLEHGYTTNVANWAADDGWSLTAPTAVVFFGEPVPWKHGIVTSGVNGDGGAIYFQDLCSFGVCRTCNTGSVYLYFGEMNALEIKRGTHVDRCGERYPLVAESAYRAAQFQWMPKR